MLRFYMELCGFWGRMQQHETNEKRGAGTMKSQPRGFVQMNLAG